MPKLNCSTKHGWSWVQQYAPNLGLQRMCSEGHYNVKRRGHGAVLCRQLRWYFQRSARCPPPRYLLPAAAPAAAPTRPLVLFSYDSQAFQKSCKGRKRKKHTENEGFTKTFAGGAGGRLCTQRAASPVARFLFAPGP